MQWINQGTDAKRVFAFRPNSDVDEWFIVAEDRDELESKHNENVNGDQCGNCGSMVPCKADDPRRIGEAFDGTPLRPAAYTVQGDRVYCDCGEMFRITLKPENAVTF